MINWKLTLVVIALLPIAGALGGAVGKVMSSSAAAGVSAYATAGGIAEEAISSIRTLTSINAQPDIYKRYAGQMDKARAAANKNALNSGLLFGAFNLFLFGAYALAFWYGAVLLTEDTTLEGGDILTVFFCVLMGALNLGSAGPSMSAVQAAQAVAFKAYKVIDRVPPVDVNSTEGIQVDPASRGQVELRDVSFSYVRDLCCALGSFY